MSLGVKPTHVNNCKGHDSSVQQFSVQNDDESWGKLYLGYNNRFLNMNSFYAKFTYTQNTFYLIKQIHLNHKKFSSHSYWATENCASGESNSDFCDISTEVAFGTQSRKRRRRPAVECYTGTNSKQTELTMSDQYRVPSCEHDMSMGHDDPYVLY